MILAGERHITSNWTLPAQKGGREGGELKVTEFSGSFLISRRGTYSRKKLPNFQTGIKNLVKELEIYLEFPLSGLSL